MAKSAATVSTATGLFWWCSSNGAVRRNPATGKLEPIHEHPVAIEIMRGPQRYHLPTCSCGARTFLSRKWAEGMGYTAAQAKKLGLVIQ